MGLTTSVEEAAVKDETPKSNPTSLESVLAEAVAYGNEETEVFSLQTYEYAFNLQFSYEIELCKFQSIEKQAQKALECPCIADLRSGPCGFQFSEAFLCFFKSTAEEKGSDCVCPFVALQNCIKANPNAFSKDILYEDEVKEMETTQEYKIIPPTWSKESQSPKSKL